MSGGSIEPQAGRRPATAIFSVRSVRSDLVTEMKTTAAIWAERTISTQGQFLLHTAQRYSLERNCHATNNLQQRLLLSHRPSSGAYLLHSILHTNMVIHAHHRSNTVLIRASMDSVKAVSRLQSTSVMKLFTICPASNNS